LLYTLVAWREEQARHRDRPRGHIMENGDLMAIAQHAPADSAALDGVRGLARNTLQRHRQAILDAITVAAQLPPGTLPDADEANERLGAVIKKKIQERQQSVAAIASQHGIDPALVGTKADITALVRFETGDTTSPPPQRLTTGWRARLLASAVSAEPT
jgi:ribonuclease D